MRAKSYDVVIVDPYLTGAIHDGAGLLGSIETMQARAFTIVLTAYASPALATAAGNLKSAVVLSKPQSIVSLSELMANAFAHALPSSYEDRVATAAARAAEEECGVEKCRRV
jgi:DNA-binding NtrC family response regulator